MSIIQEFEGILVESNVAEETRWDVAIIGSGIGGSTAAYALTLSGLNVLLIEKGLSSFSDSATSDMGIETNTPEDRLSEGKWPTKLRATVNGTTSEIWAPLGCGIGGSSLLYSSALSRLEPVDFTLQTIPDGRKVSWPFDYKELEPFYEHAEKLYSVAGTENPLTKQSPFQLFTPPKISDVDQHFFENFKQCGLNPYRLHIGVKNVPGCNLCGGYLCKKKCKQDAIQSCLIPALKTGNLSILDETEVQFINADRIQATHIVVRRKGIEFRISADKYILAAGAYFSPTILQRSKNDSWPMGLGNDYDMVGRNLMFHVSEHIGIWPKGRFSDHGIRGAIALRDFYLHNGKKYGEFQSTGTSAGYGDILYYLRTIFDKSAFRHVSILRHFLRLPAYISAKLFSNATVFVCILEDFPYPENRIILDDSAPSGMRVEYTIHNELDNRVRMFRKIIKSAVKSNYLFPLMDGIFLNHGHPCGTCSAGSDPETSVVDSHCKVHGLTNLYIADASTMPTSGGANPSLTIAANALRVSNLMSKKTA
jgi:choline dehydrogenase-like flavoprotein